MKTGILLTVRLKSTRLPRKALLEINGKPLIQHLIERMQRSSLGDNVVVMTSNLPEDEDLIAFAKTLGVKSFAGDPVDVLVRMRDAAHHFEFDRVVSATGDNPFVDTECLERAIEFQEKNRFDLVSTEGIPWGTFCYVLTTSGIETACTDKDEVDTEVWGDYFRKNSKLKCGVLEITDPALVWPKLRLTVDTLEDLKMVQLIADSLGEGFGLREIIAYCRQHPEVVSINSTVEQKIAIPAKLKQSN